MDYELKSLLQITRRFPPVRGFGQLGGLLARFYGRKSRSAVTIDVFGCRMVLDPGECVDRALLFIPHLYERLEVQCLRRHLQPGDFFLDAGANIGFYSLIAAGLVGSTGRVLAVEADPENYDKLTTNIGLNSYTERIVAVHVGLSDKREILRLGLNLTGNRGGHSFLAEGQGAVMVECDSLNVVLQRAQFNKVDVAKFDIEGFEHRVLKRYLDTIHERLVPRTILLEQTASHLKLGAGDALMLLRNYGFCVTKIDEDNYLAVRK